MAPFLQTLSLAFLISSAASVIIAGGAEGGLVVEITPTCHLKANPSSSPAWNIPTFCDCGAFGSYLTVTPTAIPGNHSALDLCAYAETAIPNITPIAPTPITCNLESATTGFTVPNTWCDCTAGKSTSTYSTKFGAPPTGTAHVPACAYMQDELPAAISPTAAQCIVEGTAPSSPFYDVLAWCACGDNAPHPLTNGNCNFTTTPTSTVTPTRLSSTTCRLTSLYTSVSTYCECDGACTRYRFPTQTAGNDPCVFSTVPTATATFDSLIGNGAGSPVCMNPGGCYTCDEDGQTIVSFPFRRGAPRRPQAEKGAGAIQG